MNSQDIETLQLYLPHGQRVKIARAAQCSKVTVDRALRSPRTTGYAAQRHRLIRQLAIEAGAYVRTEVGYQVIKEYQPDKATI